MKRNNRGFSLVELIVVVAILGACVGLITASISTVSSSQARKCAASLDAALSRCRVAAMSRAGTVSMTVSVDGDGVVTVKQLEKNGETVTETASDAVGSSRCAVSYQVKGEAAATALDAAGFTLSFDRDTGAFDFTGTPITSITVSGGGRTYVITLDALTGAHQLGG